MPTTFTNIIDVDLSRANNYSVNVKTPVHQWDTGIVLKITGVNLPTGTTVQFDSKRTTYNFEIESSGTGFLCEVPNACLGDDMAGDLMAHIHVATSDYGVVIYDVHIPVIRRMKPATYISSNDPTDETVFTAPVSVSDVANNNTATLTATDLIYNNVPLSRVTENLYRRNATEITSTGVDLNTLAFMRVGEYFVTYYNTAKTFINSPTNNAWRMRVEAIVGTEIDEESTHPHYVYRYQELTDINGDTFSRVNYIQSDGTAVYSTWRYALNTQRPEYIMNIDRLSASNATHLVATQSDNKLNHTKWMNPGLYTTWDNSEAQAFTDSPSDRSFRMTVKNLTGGLFNFDNVDISGNYLYMIREITDIMGNQWVQWVHHAPSSGWTYDAWKSVGGSNGITTELLYESTGNYFNFQGGRATLSKTFDQFSFILFFYEGANSQSANFSYQLPVLAIHVSTSSTDYYDNCIMTNFNTVNMLRVDSDKKTFKFSGSSMQCKKLRIYGVK